MQKIDRLPLSDATQSKLVDLGRQVATAEDPKHEAQALWTRLDRGLKNEIQAILASMSSGLERCMYCEDSQGTDIEHFRPKSSFPEHTFSWLNYLLACTRCNSNYKRTKFPLDAQNEPLLINPTKDDPSSHLLLSPTTGLYVGLDPKGLTTIDVCGLNRDICTAGRINAWTSIECLIPAYAKAVRLGKSNSADKILLALRKYPFQSVRATMANLFVNSDNPELFLSDDVLEAFKEFPQLL
ncbi:HNH endonuclease [Acrocarpospora pleiomorpha]|uniref:HNH endonuclease n=1 Tax=Acrocarpospora pleiomorpha TaxID=90975 RepID=A0A5M3XT75_9ACTN|nr:HNH endonuclease [Acrocarpospora pleiomorpha]GES24497.1 HNH endonuclease [Acrocarpospora pleiomorpha]